MPTQRAKIKFNSSVIDGDDALNYESHIFSVRCRDEKEILTPFPLEKRWFHCEFMRVVSGVEKYTRRALFGNFAVDETTKEERFFIQKLSDSSERVKASSRSVNNEELLSLGSLRKELKENTVDLEIKDWGGIYRNRN